MKFQLCLILFIFFMAISSCAKKEPIQSAVDEALFYLSQSPPKCQSAINVLAKVEDEASTKDAKFFEAYASAYACRAGFSELTLFDEIDLIDANATALLGSLTTLSTSEETEVDSDSFEDLFRGINIALYAGGGTTSSVLEREANLGVKKAGNLNLQALYMILAQLGKFFHFYGNVDSDGVKGAGTANQDEQGPVASSCLFQYSGQALAVINGNPATGACDNPSDLGHPDLSADLADRSLTITRMCYGVILFNNLLDILSNTTLSSNDSMGDLGSIAGNIQTVIAAVQGALPQLTTLIEAKDLDVCEDHAATNFDNLELYYVSFFETGLL